MLVSAETRWFWSGGPPAGLKEWFCEAGPHGCPAGGGKPRSDEYLRDRRQVELGIKRRGGKTGVEIKGLVAAAWADLTVEPFSGPMELWAKWTSEPLELASAATITLEKTRFLRQLDASGPSLREVALDAGERPIDGSQPPSAGCNIEWTQVLLPSGDVWWTLAFEAYGGVADVASHLRAGAAAMSARQPPAFTSGRRQSYPAWLSEHAIKT